MMGARAKMQSMAEGFCFFVEMGECLHITMYT